MVKSSEFFEEVIKSDSEEQPVNTCTKKESKITQQYKGKQHVFSLTSREGKKDYVIHTAPE